MYSEAYLQKFVGTSTNTGDKHCFLFAYNIRISKLCEYFFVMNVFYSFVFLILNSDSINYLRKIDAKIRISFKLD